MFLECFSVCDIVINFGEFSSLSPPLGGNIFAHPNKIKEKTNICNKNFIQHKYNYLFYAFDDQYLRINIQK